MTNCRTWGHATGADYLQVYSYESEAVIKSLKTSQQSKHQLEYFSICGKLHD